MEGGGGEAEGKEGGCKQMGMGWWKRKGLKQSVGVRG